MKSSIKYIPFKKAVVRTPLLPLSIIFELTEKSKENSEIFEIYLKEIFNQPLLKESIFLASPILYEEAIKWLTNSIDSNKEKDRIKLSLIRYLLRMSSRCTPFGLFAGCSIAEISQIETNIYLSEQKDYYRHTRLDMMYLCNLSLEILKNEGIKKNLRYFANSSIYPSGKQLRYVEFRFVNSRRNHFLVQVEDSAYLQLVLNEASNGNKQPQQLAESISKYDPEISIEEAYEFIDNLIDAQVLVSELEPSVTGQEYIDCLIEIIGQIPEANEFYETLIKIQDKIKIIDSKSPGVEIGIYKEVIELANQLKIPFETKFLFQTDLIKPITTSNISQDIVNEIIEGITVLGKFSRLPKTTNLSLFINNFIERYEEREVSLLEVLDNETGIGYIQNNNRGDINPLVDDLAIQRSNPLEIEWSKKNSFLLKKYIECTKTSGSEIVISEKDIEHFHSDLTDLPETMAALVSIIPDHNGDRKIIISNIGGSSAANLLGRFCHSDSKIYQFTKEITEREHLDNEDKIIAEIVHLPESRTGNILLRPNLRKYEIPFLAKL